jgi:hypothetical protein
MSFIPSLPWDARPNKNTARDLVTTNIGTKYNNIMVMPGDPACGGCKDILNLIQTGAATKSDLFVAIEQDREIADRLRQWGRDNGFTNWVVLRCKLKNVTPWMVDLLVGSRVMFDYVYLDCCGELTQPNYSCILRMAERFAPDCRAVFSFQTYRFRKWADKCWQQMGGQHIGDEHKPAGYDEFCRDGFVVVGPHVPRRPALNKAFLLQELLREIFGTQHEKMVLYRDTAQWMCVLEYTGQAAIKVIHPEPEMAVA